MQNNGGDLQRGESNYHNPKMDVGMSLLDMGISFAEAARNMGRAMTLLMQGISRSVRARRVITTSYAPTLGKGTDI